MLHQHHYHCNSSSRCKHCRCLLGCVSSLTQKSIKEKESLRWNNGTSITCRGHPWLHPLLYGLWQTFRCGWPRVGCQLWSWHQQLSGTGCCGLGTCCAELGSCCAKLCKLMAGCAKVLFVAALILVAAFLAFVFWDSTVSGFGTVRNDTVEFYDKAREDPTVSQVFNKTEEYYGAARDKITAVANAPEVKRAGNKTVELYGVVKDQIVDTFDQIHQSETVQGAINGTVGFFSSLKDKLFG
ncbi:uncharacterized protein LOC128093338 [Culex pipiens pallens]|uniref:uncharacterized protein LOC128093338 n=1 Tax=Culex pipiens pallens TaxID=42434 RepID=UPI0022A9FC7A|nr:uncharacterized protein LOC128093338 [Culex pipiens pallens]